MRKGASGKLNDFRKVTQPTDGWDGIWTRSSDIFYWIRDSGSLLGGHAVEGWFHQQNGAEFHEMGLWMPTCASDKIQVPVSFVAYPSFCRTLVFLRAGLEEWPWQINPDHVFPLHTKHIDRWLPFSLWEKNKQKNIYASIHGKTWKQLTVVLGRAIWNVCRHLDS